MLICPCACRFPEFSLLFSILPNSTRLVPMHLSNSHSYIFLYLLCVCLLLFSSCSSFDCVLSSPVHTRGNESQHTNNTYSHTCKYMRSSKAAGKRVSPFIYLIKRHHFLYACLPPFLFVENISASSSQIPGGGPHTEVSRRLWNPLLPRRPRRRAEFSGIKIGGVPCVRQSTVFDSNILLQFSRGRYLEM